MESSSFIKGLLFGGCASCVAETCTLPIDVVKALFLGLTPALLRQATYGSLRYGLYTPFKRFLASDSTTEFPVWKKILAGCGAGAVSSALCTPTDLIKVRMQADGMRAAMGEAANQRNYNSVYDAFTRIVREEGFRGLYKGVGPTCTRATVLAAAELSSYDELKLLVQNYGVGNGITSHLLASLGAGFIGSLASNPFDLMKSRMMSQPVGSDGKGLLYSNMAQCFWRSVSKEGVLVLWSGFVPTFCRTGPNTVIVYLVMEQLKNSFD